MGFIDKLMNFMNLKELAAINGISISTAKRYKKDGVDLTDAQAFVQGVKRVARGGIEPPTRGFSVLCSAN